LRRHLTERFPPEWFTFARNAEFASTNNAYSLAMGRYSCDEPMLLSDADLLFEEGVLTTLLASRHENSLALRSHGGVGEEEMKASVDSAGRITKLGKEIPVAQAAGESIGLELFSPAFAKRLFDTLDRRMFEEKRVDEYYEASFVELIERGEIVHAVDIGELRCMEIDTLEDLERARQVFG
jgi:choline kinase